MNFKSIVKHPYFFSVMAFSIITFLLLLLLTVIRYEKNIEDDIFKVATSDVLQITQHKALYIKSILEKEEGYISSLKQDKHLRKKLEKNIQNLLTDNIKYAYIVYKDKNDIFRFLVDGSNENEKSFVNQKFDVTSSKWFELYETKEPVIIKHSVLQKLSISYLVPILKNDKVELIMVIDFSINKIKKIEHIITMMKVGLVLILLICIVSLSILVVQLIRYKSMKRSSIIDRLTNIYNRNFLHDIEEDLKLFEYILVVLDIDHFKKVNDTYGHDVGDIILKEMGDILKNSIRIEEDIAIRYGGEEFVVLIRTKQNDDETALNVVNRIHSDIKYHKFFINEEKYLNVTVSIGVNKFPDRSKNFNDAFKLADLALYEAKSGGRDRVKIYDNDLQVCLI